MANTAQSSIAILDVGTTKLCCILAHVDDAGEIHVEGIGHHVAEGVKNGVVTDMGLAENAIRSVVQSAEDMAGRTIDDIIIVTTAGDISSSIFSVEVAVSGHEVEAADIKRVLKLARKQMADEARTILHALPACYSVDNAMGVRSPEGMFGERLGVDFHMVTAEPSPLQNLATCVQRCHLNVTSLIAAPYAAGHAVLHDEEKELGVACVDMGGGSTSISLFCGGVLVDCTVLPIGGDAITRDIAKMLSTPLVEAERLKTLYGTVLECASDHQELLDVRPLAEPMPSAGGRIRKSQLTGLIRPRVEETLEYVADTLRASGFLGQDMGTVVFTGGASEMPGINHLGEQILGAPVRFGYPQMLRGLAEAATGPAFAAPVGAIIQAAKALEEQDEGFQTQASEGGNWSRRIVRWLREAL